eukprot:4636140-Prymnesium_polylepis.1
MHAEQVAQASRNSIRPVLGFLATYTFQVWERARETREAPAQQSRTVLVAREGDGCRKHGSRWIQYTSLAHLGLHGVHAGGLRLVCLLYGHHARQVAALPLLVRVLRLQSDVFQLHAGYTSAAIRSPLTASALAQPNGHWCIPTRPCTFELCAFAPAANNQLCIPTRPCT